MILEAIKIEHHWPYNSRYDKKFNGVPADARKLLEDYAHVSPEDVEDYALTMVNNLSPKEPHKIQCMSYGLLSLTWVQER